jgi:hypothetical protein
VNHLTYIRGPLEKFVDWRQCATVIQREAVTVTLSCYCGGNVVVAWSSSPSELQSFKRTLFGKAEQLRGQFEKFVDSLLKKENSTTPP